MFVPSWLETLLQIKNGAIGRPRFMNFMHARKMYQKREKFYSKELAGGMLSSLGEYPLAFAYWVFNKEEPVNIVASGYNFGTGVDKTHSVTMSYRNGETLTSFISCGRHIFLLLLQFSFVAIHSSVIIHCRIQ